jgi:SAM-dependent methyltransferase
MRDRHSAERDFAEFYALYAADFSRDLPIYLELAAKSPGPVFEVGCRTGRVASHLAAAGHRVCAVDTSRAMLQVARAELEPWEDRVRIADFDLRHSALYGSFSAVFVPLFTFNALIEIEEQRLFLRHIARSTAESAVIAIDLFCPLSHVRPEVVGEWRTIDRCCDGVAVRVRDRREMLTPLLERRTQVFSIGGRPECEFVTHRRYIAPHHAAALLSESGFENVRWVQDYDLSSARPVDPADRPSGPFMLLAER